MKSVNKKGLLIAIILLPSLMLVACGKDESRPTLDERMEATQDEKPATILFEGEVQPLETTDIYQKGTHQLLVDEEIIFLQSRTIDLSDYLGDQVRVEGEMQKGIGSTKSVLSVIQIERLAQADDLGDESYQNESFGLGFKYPSAWQLNEGGEVIGLQFEQNDLVKITGFTGQGDLDEVASTREIDTPVEVTVGDQRALRYIQGSNITVYVPNPPKDSVYQITFAPTLGEHLEENQERFYDLLKSVELYYMTPLEGKACGGEPPIACDEGYVCQLGDGSEFAEGVCVSVDEQLTGNSCPIVSKPDCEEYRIADYTTRGCPSRYECVTDGEGLDPNGSDDTGSESDDASTSENSMDADYKIPSASQVTQEYINKKQGFKVLLPKEWYYASFGPIDGSVWTVGFLDEELEAVDKALVTLTIQDTAGGQASRKVGNLYYVFEGPEDLTPVMEAMANSVGEVDIEEE